MNASYRGAGTIFGQALPLTDPAKRAAYLDRACAGDPALRQEVESLLAAHEQAGGFMNTGAMAASTRAVPVEQAGDRIGRYKLLEQVGEGGFGVVWMAEQEEPVRRRVALKIIKLGMDTKEVVARFEAERQALAMMDHPNIARVFDGGATDTGRPYFVMELVKGIPLTEYCDAAQLPTAERLGLFMQVCQAVQHAHQKGVIHRDLKPSNVLVTVQDDRPVPKVIDFGVAKATQARLTEKTLFTRLNQWIGTPAYMSPEQAGLGSLDVDTRSDVYSLGVLLYELLTGRPPFDTQELLAAGYEVVMRTIREEEPPKPSTRLSTLAEEELSAVAARRGAEPGKLGRLVRGDLDWIVMKCLEKERTRRYDTPHALAQDVERYLNREPVWAMPPRVSYRFRKFVSRNQLTVAAGAAVITALALGAVGSTWQWRRAQGARQEEARQRQVAEAYASEKRAQLVRLDYANGVRALDNEDGYGALLWFGEAMRQDVPGSPADRMHRYRISALLAYAPRLTRLWMHDAAVRSIAFSPDGRRVLSAGRDGTARLWDVESAQPGISFPCGTEVSDVSFSAEGRRVLTFSRNAATPVMVWDAATGQPACPPLDHGYRLSHAFISSDGRRVFTLGDPREPTPFSGPLAESEERGEIRIWDATAGRQVREPLKGKDWIRDMAVSRDGRWLAAVLRSSVVAWDLRHPRLLRFSNATNAPAVVVPGLDSGAAANDVEALLPALPASGVVRSRSEGPAASCLAFSPDGNRLLVGNADGSGWIRTLPDSSPLVLRGPKARAAPARPAGAQFAAFTPDGQRVVLMDYEGVVQVWSAATGESEGRLENRSGAPPEFGPDGRLVFVAGQVWDLERRESVSPRPLHAFSTCAAFSPDGARVATGGTDGSVRLWELAGAIPAHPPLRHNWDVVAAGRAEAGTTLEDGVGLPFQQQLRQQMLQSLGEMRRALFSPDGRRVLTVHANGSARVWEALSGRPVTPFVTVDAPLMFGAFSVDGALFVTSGGYSDAGCARVWSTTTGRPVSPVIRWSEPLNDPCFSADGRYVFAATAGGVRAWDAQTGQPAELPCSGGHRVLSIAVSPDGRRMALSSDRTPAASGPTASWPTASYEARVYDPATGQAVTPPLAETNQVREMDFSPNGRWLLTLATRPRTNWSRGFFIVDSGRLWDANTGEAVTPAFQGFVTQVVFTRDSRLLFVLRAAGDPLIWDLRAHRSLDPQQWRGLKPPGAVPAGDGERVATMGERGLRVCDARTGDLLTPLLRDGSEYRYARLGFSPDGNLLVAAAGDRAQLWQLSPDPRPAEDVVAIAELLAGRRLGASGDILELSAPELSRAWRTLQARYPATFEVAPAQVRTWRERIVAASEGAGQWFTAAFHLDRLVETFPGDEALRLRRARARNEAAMAELGAASDAP